MNQDKAITSIKDMELDQKFCHFLGQFSLQWEVPFSPKKPGQIIINHKKIETANKSLSSINFT